MKKLLIIFLIIISTPAMALYTNDIQNMCGLTDVNIYAVFEPISYTCGAGYFLPANTPGCQPCPAGFVCSGGTFAFNPTCSQGATKPTQITHNATRACSVDLTDFAAVFERATINLNFDDGNGNTTTTTCTYGDTITIPDTIPTRPGYNFAGWVVRQNTDE